MSRIILAQNDYKIGNLEYNYNKIKNSIIKAKEYNAQLIVFSEFALVGYPIGDILTRHKCLIDEQENYLNQLAELADNITVVLGGIDNNSNSSIRVLQNQKIIYDTDLFELDNKKYQIISGEFPNLKYKGADTIVHCTVSNSRYGKEFKLNEYINSLIKKYNVNYIWVNQAGYNDNLVFDGNSRVYNKNGNLTARGKIFEEDFIITDDLLGKIEKLPTGSEIKQPDEFSLNNYGNDLDRLYKSLIAGIKGYFAKTGFSKAVLGLSGGLDSTICAVLLADALGKDNVYAISMPTKISSQNSKDDAATLVKNLGIHYIEAPISNEINVFTEELNSIFGNIKADKYNSSTTFENIQARTRATLLWSISNEFKGMLPIATSDKSEAYIGYATTNGDMSGGFAPIADVTKTKLFALGRFLNNFRNEKNVIPENILQKPPGAELKFDKEKGRTITAEEDNMPYIFLDEIIWLVENHNYSSTDLKSHKFFYEKENPISQQQKEEWIDKFYRKMNNAVFKWHILPPSIITDAYTINQSEYYQPII